MEWNITGYVADYQWIGSNTDILRWFCLRRTILSSAGNDGRIRLWKATGAGVWRSAGSISVEQAEEQEDVDVEMDDHAGAE